RAIRIDDRAPDRWVLRRLVNLLQLGARRRLLGAARGEIADRFALQIRIAAALGVVEQHFMGARLVAQRQDVERALLESEGIGPREDALSELRSLCGVGVLDALNRQQLDLLVIDRFWPRLPDVGFELLGVLEVPALRLILAERVDRRDRVFRLARLVLRERLPVPRAVSVRSLLSDRSVEADDGLVVLPVLQQAQARVVGAALGVLAHAGHHRAILKVETK